MSAVTCLTCDGVGEVPTADTAALPSVGGFPHPNTVFVTCHVCDGTGYVEAVAS